jgi:hypothetical protein
MHSHLRRSRPDAANSKPSSKTSKLKPIEPSGNLQSFVGLMDIDQLLGRNSTSTKTGGEVKWQDLKQTDQS